MPPSVVVIVESWLARVIRVGLSDIPTSADKATENKCKRAVQCSAVHVTGSSF
jgi:hypothetical protein